MVIFNQIINITVHLLIFAIAWQCSSCNNKSTQDSNRNSTVAPINMTKQKEDVLISKIQIVKKYSLGVNSLESYDKMRFAISEANNSKYVYDTSGNIQKLMDTLKLVATKKMKIYFPKIRKQYAEELKALLWQENINVKWNGDKCNSLILIGHQFSNNREILKTKDVMLTPLQNYKFKELEFRWYDHDSDPVNYLINSKKDFEFDF